MSQAFYNGLSGLASFSQGLDQVSNNISNMNTAGFRGKGVFYQSVAGDSGSQAGGEYLRDQQGEIRRTGNSSDLAISGNGYFILQQDGKTFLSRAGQFTFDENNVLVDRNSGAMVSGVNDNGELVTIDLSEYKEIEPVASNSVTLSGNLSSDAKNHVMNNVSLFNDLGEELDYRIELLDRTVLTEVQQDADGNDIDVPTGESSWKIQVTDSEGNAAYSGEIRYADDGHISSGYDFINFDIPANSDDIAGNQNSIQLDFSNTTSFSEGSYSNMSFSVDDGHALAGLTKVEFENDGSIVMSYSNGEEKNIHKVALATVNNQDLLHQENGSLFSVAKSSDFTFGVAGVGEFGTIEGGSIELANVDMAEEFADMMIIQRGYQASSKVMNIANELIETLYNSTR